MSTTAAPVNPNLPPAANKVGGARVSAPRKHSDKSSEDEAAAPTAQTSTEIALQPNAQPIISGGDHSTTVTTSNVTNGIVVRDAAEHAKANASTYYPPEPKHDKHYDTHNQSNRNKQQIQQPGLKWTSKT